VTIPIDVMFAFASDCSCRINCDLINSRHTVTSKETRDVEGLGQRKGAGESNHTEAAFIQIP
jgi:hypothetical protein